MITRPPAETEEWLIAYESALKEKLAEVRAFMKFVREHRQQHAHVSGGLAPIAVTVEKAKVSNAGIFHEMLIEVLAKHGPLAPKDILKHVEEIDLPIGAPYMRTLIAAERKKGNIVKTDEGYRLPSDDLLIELAEMVKPEQP